MEHKQAEAPEDPAKRLLLKRLAVMAVGATLLPTLRSSDGNPKPPEPPKIDERERLKAEILKKFGITVFDPEVLISSTTLLVEYQRMSSTVSTQIDRIAGIDREVAKVITKDVVKDVASQGHQDVPYYQLQQTTRQQDADEHKILTLPWTEQTLRFVHSILKILPVEFVNLYRDRIKDKEVELYFMDKRERKRPDPLSLIPSLKGIKDDGIIGRTIYGDSTHPSVILYSDYMQTADKQYTSSEWVAGTIIHELTHIIVSLRTEQMEGEDYDRLTQRAVQILGATTNGMPYDNEIIPEIIEPLIHSGEIRVTYDKDGKKEYKHRTYVGYAGISWHEFLPRAAETYIMGKEFFVKLF